MSTALAVRLPQVLDWLAANPDMQILGLQETKLSDDKFPVQAFAEAGWQVQFSGKKPTTAWRWSAVRRCATWCTTFPAWTATWRA